jgi:PPK2 family polyphosphate:nucleotide phosphotransferase
MPFSKNFIEYLDTLKVAPHQKCELNKFNTDYDHKMITKEEGELLLQEGIKQIAALQDKLYSHNQYSLLIILQAMDAAGKDSAIKHVMSGLNPQGVKITSFKTPTDEELDHDYLWRHYKALPARGEIGIFNRSHYENVLVTRVHPEYILSEKLPGINTTEDIDEAFWQKRFKQINRFEKTLAQNGTIILKFFLHVSKKEQKKRFIERIDDPAKNWKFAAGDIKERQRWNDYMHAYEQMLQATSKPHAPWFVLPADDKWFTRICMGGALHAAFEKMNVSYPQITPAQKQQLTIARQQLLDEKE